MNDKQIACKLGISERSFKRYKENFKELNQVLNEGRRDLVTEFRDKYIDIALNGIVEEIFEETTRTVDEDGNIKTIKRTIKRKKGNIDCLNKLLINYDSEWHENDFITLKNKEDEIELKKKKFSEDYPNNEDLIDF